MLSYIYPYERQTQVSESINMGVINTKEVVENGNKTISALQEQVKVSASASILTEQELTALSEYMEKVNSIVQIINADRKSTRLNSSHL